MLLGFRVLLCVCALSPLHRADPTGTPPVRPARYDAASREDRSAGSWARGGHHGRLPAEVLAAVVPRRDVKASVINITQRSDDRRTGAADTDGYGRTDETFRLRGCRDAEERCVLRRRVKRDRKTLIGASGSDGVLATVEPPLPRPMRQEQDPPDGPATETSDYEAFTPPDLRDLSPLHPRTKWKHLRNPFFPLSAEACGAWAVMIAASLIFSVGILGNVAVMCIVCYNYHMRSISNSLLANLAFWDFLVLFFCLPLVVFHQLTKDWLLGEFTCRIIPYLEVASLGVTTFTLCALCIDRLRSATSVQASYQPVENAASTGAKLAVIWVGALLLALPELLLRQLLTEEAGGPEGGGVGGGERCVVRISTRLPDTLYVLGLTYHGARLWWCFGCYFCLPTLFTICCSLASARHIRRAQAQAAADAVARGNQPAGSSRSRKQLRAESQMNCAVVALAILYGFCSVPENICNVLSLYMPSGVSVATMDALHLASQMLLFCRPAATPLLVFALCRPFRRAYGDCCCCCWAQCSDPAPSPDSDPAPDPPAPDPPAPGPAPAPAPTDDRARVRAHVRAHDSITPLELLPLRPPPHRQPGAKRYTAADMHC